MHADGTVIALDVTVVGSGDAAKDMIRRKTIGWGSLGALEKARGARADTWEKVRERARARPYRHGNGGYCPLLRCMEGLEGDECDD